MKGSRGFAYRLWVEAFVLFDAPLSMPFLASAWDDTPVIINANNMYEDVKNEHLCHVGSLMYE
jgi:hypothetical protein